ncbi:MAG TPA: hypothetical protein VGB74_07805, partial [Actinoplanes sp.]
DHRLALIAAAHPVDLAVGAPVVLPGPTHAVIVESGVIALADGVELRRGTLIGPVGEGSPGAVAQTRTPARLWVLPDASDLPPLVGAAYRPGSPMPVASINSGLRPSVPDGRSYPPLAVPPGPPDGILNPDVDKRFERRLRLLVLLLLITALLLTAVTFRAAPAWAEMPRSDVLLTVSWGRMTAALDDQQVSLTSGSVRYLDSGDQIIVPTQGGGWLTFPGGSITMLCPGARLDVARVSTGEGRRQAPAATLNLKEGRVLADTTSTSGAYDPLRLTINRQGGAVTNDGPAWFAVTPEAPPAPAGVAEPSTPAQPEPATAEPAPAPPAPPATVSVSVGTVAVGGTATPATNDELSCGDGVPVKPPSEATPTPEPIEESLPVESTPAVDPGTTAPETGSVDVPPVADPGPAGGGTTTGPRPTATTRPPTTRPTTRPPAATTPPTTRPPAATTPPTSAAPTTPPPTTPTPTTPEPTEVTSVPQQSISEAVASS